jgi:hypothetical protein
MKKIIIIAAVILSSALTALSISRKPAVNNSAEISKMKNESLVLAEKSMDAQKSDVVSSAD